MSRISDHLTPLVLAVAMATGACNVDIEEIECLADSECATDQVCVQGVCVAGEPTVVDDPDPLPEQNEPGAYICPDGPSWAPGSTVIDAGDEAFWELNGLVRNDPNSGVWYVRNDGRSLRGDLGTSEDGLFDLSAPLFCGENLLKLVWENDFCTSAVVFEITSSTPCVNSDIYAALVWGSQGQDYDLHLIRPGGQLNHTRNDCNSRNCLQDGPDWGEPGNNLDDPIKDRDDRGERGPESIYLEIAEDGVYSVMVEHRSLDGSAFSDGRVILQVDGDRYVSEIFDLPPHYVWEAARINWISREVTILDRVIDCSADWGNGCNLDLP